MAGGIETVSKMDKKQVLFLRFEDLARSPVLVAKMVHGFLGIPFTEEQERVVQNISLRQRFDTRIDASEMLQDASNWPKEVCAPFVHAPFRSWTT